MSEKTVAIDMAPVRAFGRQMAREMSIEEFEMLNEAILPTANPEIAGWSTIYQDPPPQY